MDRVAAVRRFNRTVTQRVGALDDRFLALERPLGEARLLWEIGPEGRDVRSLRSQLELDSGYLSRLLRSLERARLVDVEPSAADRRVRTARLTERGLAERALLDSRSDELAASLLAPLNGRQRTGSCPRWRRSSACSPPGWSRSSPPTRLIPTRVTASPSTSRSSAGASRRGSIPPRASRPEPEVLRPPTGWCWWPGCARAGGLRGAQVLRAGAPGHQAPLGGRASPRARAGAAAAVGARGRAHESGPARCGSTQTGH